MTQLEPTPLDDILDDFDYDAEHREEVSRGNRPADAVIPATSLTAVLIDRLGVLGEEILTELRHLRAAHEGTTASNPDASERRSSVEIKTSTRGVDITTKAYTGSDILEAESAAVASYFRVLNEVQERLMNGATKP